MCHCEPRRGVAISRKNRELWRIATPVRALVRDDSVFYEQGGTASILSPLGFPRAFFI